ncbi:hypothetical protein AGLY_005936 [Aphis glycines]|uniref:Uncharacterized protein n=1 Tax=Aphis glycines TaxID=307491 RepID=A0A6G0TSH0_APHGL|nr:hypothetical protein AGLY_005936 [Aphis glycines]
MSITSRNNAPISNYGGGFRCKSEYPWCIIEFKFLRNLSKTRKFAILKIWYKTDKSSPFRIIIYSCVMIGLQYMNMGDNRSQAILIIVPERFLKTLYGLIQNGEDLIRPMNVLNWLAIIRMLIQARNFMSTPNKTYEKFIDITTKSKFNEFFITSRDRLDAQLLCSIYEASQIKTFE